MIKGIRQCGKTYIIQKFAKENYESVVYMSKNTLFQANKQGFDTLFQANNLLKRHFWERINKNHSTKDANYGRQSDDTLHDTPIM